MVDIIDYTLLQKKGLLKKREIKKQPYKINKEGMLDFTSVNNVNDNSSSQSNIPNDGQTAANQESQTSPFSFLDSLAQGTTPIQSTEGLKDSAELSALKIKIDDLEYKIERLIERLERIELGKQL